MNNRLDQLLNQCDPRSHLQSKLLVALFEELPPDSQEQLTVEYHISDVNTWIDLAFPKVQVAIYCDGFCPHTKHKPFTNDTDQCAFSRDRYQSRELQLRGWLVLRFSQRDIERYIDSAVKTILRALDYKSLPITDYTIAIELNPDAAQVYYNRGVAYYKKGDYDRAIADNAKAIELNPGYAKAYGNRGVAFHTKGDYDRAILDYVKVIELDPDDARAYYNRGVAYYKKGDYNRAIADYTKAIALNPGYTKAYDARGVAYDADFTKVPPLQY